MTYYNTLNVKLSNPKLNKLKLEIQKETKVTSFFSSNFVGDSNDETNFPHELLVANTHVLRFRKVFATVSSANIKLTKT